jgi:hypothetical protein
MVTENVSAVEQPEVAQPELSTKVVMMETVDKRQIAVPVSDVMSCTQLLPQIKPNEVIKLPHISSRILSLVLSYLRHHKDDKFDGDLKSAAFDDARDGELLSMNNNDLLQTLMAADILGTAQLIACLNKLMANRMEGKTEDEIRSMFDIDAIGKADEEKDEGEVEGEDEDFEEMEDDEGIIEDDDDMEADGQDA